MILQEWNILAPIAWVGNMRGFGGAEEVIYVACVITHLTYVRVC